MPIRLVGEGPSSGFAVAFDMSIGKAEVAFSMPCPIAAGHTLPLRRATQLSRMLDRCPGSIHARSARDQTCISIACLPNVG